MKHKALVVAMALCSSSLMAAMADDQLQLEVKRLQQQTRDLQVKLNQLQHQAVRQNKIKQAPGLNQSKTALAWNNTKNQFSSIVGHFRAF